MLLTGLLCPVTAAAQGGPPLITDDPDTPGPRYWEINVMTSLERRTGSRMLELPRLDANYGVGNRVQLKFEIPWLAAKTSGEPVRSGIGNAEAGVKWRFLGQEGQWLAWSVYPQVEFNVAHKSATRGLVDEHTQAFLPTEFTIEAHDIEVNAEVGRSFARGGNGAWAYGLSGEFERPPRLELLAEIHTERADHGAPETIVNAGLRYKLTEQTRLMFAAGRALSGNIKDHTDLLLLVGLQINLPGQFVFPLPPAPSRAARR